MSRKYQYSQHFLANPDLVAELIGHSNIGKNDLVYDLGAGSGVVAGALAKRCKQVVAVEVEPVALEKLRQNIRHIDNIELIKQDILEVDWPKTGYKVFSNIPFSLSSAIVGRLTSLDHPPAAIYLIVQKQFAQKLIMSDRHFTGLLGAQISPWWQVRIRRPLKRTDYTPPPNVDTVLVEIKLADKPLLDSKEVDSFRAFVEKCFSRQKYFTSLAREKASISAEKKPSELTTVQWVALYKQTTKARV